MAQKESRERRDQDRRRQVDRKLNRTILYRTVLLMVLCGILIFIPLFYTLWTIQVRDHEFYQNRAIQQQTRDNAVAANRGKILDANGNVLASSGTVYDVIISPGDFRTLQENWDKSFTDKDTGAVLTEKRGYYPRPEADTVAAALAEILNADYEKIRAYFDKNSKYELAASRMEREVAQKVWELISEMHLSNSVYTNPTTKRYYSYGSLAAQVIGWFNPNLGEGAYGLEAMYEEELAGQVGRVVTAKKGDGTEMRYSFQDYYDATDGETITLTIDTSIQYYCERILEKGIEMFEVQDGGFAIAMDPKTGKILAWANSPTYDLNTPWTVSDPVLSQYLETVQATLDEKGELTEEEKTAAYNTALSQMQNRQWRNRTINDSYEPGSTFKSIVLAAALEEGVISEANTFYCSGSYTLEGAEKPIGCSKRTGHGSQTLTQAVQNSCNPAFIMIGQALGAEKFYDYLEDFGFLNKTGIDMQGEGRSIIWPRSEFTAPSTKQNAYLATASFGQRLQVTPIQLITAASAVVNGGHLMEPYVVDSITDADGNIIQQNEPTEVRQVISEETSARCRAILEKVVDGGTGKRAYVPGYRIGGKTGSSETKKEAGEDPIINKGDDYTIVSFLSFAPADDPQVVLLLAFNAPKPSSPGSTSTAGGYYISGGNMAGRLSGELMEDILEYMGIEKVYTEDQRAFIDVTVPNVLNQTAQIGTEAIEGAGFTVRTVGEGDTVTGQIPAGGAVIPSGSQVVIYLGEEKPTDLVSVPSLWGKTAAQAQEILSKSGLYLRVDGSSRYLSSSATVASQSVLSGTQVERGTVIECQFTDNTMVD